MILYSLRCAKGHAFEAWFASSAAFDDQAAEDKLVCPMCGSRQVEKAIMAPAVSGAKKPTLNAEEIRKVRKVMSGIRKKVLEEGENVGERFPEEARAIHYGDAKERPIYGEASLDEVKELLDEGVEVAPLPPDLDEVTN